MVKKISEEKNKKSCKIKEFNEDNLLESEVTRTVTRVKLFVVIKNKILVATSAGGCQLPGGHAEKGETIEQTIIREIKEETGIALDKEEIFEQFFEIRYLSRNYKNLGVNRLSKVIYKLVLTEKKPELNNTRLTKNEKRNNFNLEMVNIEDFKTFVKKFIYDGQSEINLSIANELLEVYPHFLTAYREIFEE